MIRRCRKHGEVIRASILSALYLSKRPDFIAPRRRKRGAPAPARERAAGGRDRMITGHCRIVCLGSVFSARQRAFTPARRRVCVPEKLIHYVPDSSESAIRRREYSSRYPRSHRHSCLASKQRSRSSSFFLSCVPQIFRSKRTARKRSAARIELELDATVTRRRQIIHTYMCLRIVKTLETLSLSLSLSPVAKQIERHATLVAPVTHKLYLSRAERTLVTRHDEDEEPHRSARG